MNMNNAHHDPASEVPRNELILAIRDAFPEGEPPSLENLASESNPFDRQRITAIVGGRTWRQVDFTKWLDFGHSIDPAEEPYFSADDIYELSDSAFAYYLPALLELLARARDPDITVHFVVGRLSSDYFEEGSTIRLKQLLTESQRQVVALAMKFVADYLHYEKAGVTRGEWQSL